MPLVKRKPVEPFPPPAATGSDDPDVFYLAATGEVFADFETYSNRLSFYNQKIFQCELTGRINLSYFEALKSERKEAIALHKIFPEQLKGPVLKAVQFQITGRIDELVDRVYDRFKDRFFPGETVFFDLDGDKYYARLSKAHPPAKPASAANGDHVDDADVKPEPNGHAESSRSSPTASPAPTAQIHTVGTNLTLELEQAIQLDDPTKYVYTVDLIDDEDEPAGGTYLTSSEKLSRDRLAFSKTILRKYLRDCITRAANIGAEWRVKEWLALKYGIPLEPTDEISQKNEALKDAKLSKRKKYLLTDGEDSSASTSKKPRSDGKKLSATAQRKADEAEKAAIEKAKEEERLRKKNLKYPIEDLELDPITKRELMFKMPGEVDRRKERPLPARGEHALPVPPELFPIFLATYYFLMSTGKPLLLSPFTMDDYEHALKHQLSDPSCTLINEIHRTLVNLIVRDGGSSLVANTSALAATLDAAASAPASVNGDADEPAEQAASEAGSDVDELEPTPNGVHANGNGTTNNNDEAEAIASLLEAARELSQGWQKLTIRPDNRRERWENSLIGLIAARATPDVLPRMIGILSHLTAVEHAQGYIDGKFEADLYDTPSQRYPLLSLADKLQIINFLCVLAVGTKPVKAFYDDCEVQLTELRKEKIEVSRAKKELATAWEEFEGSKKDDEKEGDAEEGEGDAEEGDEEEGEDEEGEDDEEEEEDELASDSDTRSTREDSSFSDSGRGGRGGGSRQEILRQKALEKQAQEAARRVEEAKAREAHKAKLAENKILTAQRKKLEEEDAKLARRDETIDREFRRLILAPRMAPLGRDRFGDKYWWFDGVGSCSLVTGSEKHTYQTGRLFVQGATDDEVSLLIPDAPATAIKASPYAHLFHQPITASLITTRKAAELGGDEGTLQPGEWAVYSEPERIEQLFAWLRPKGHREHQLKQQLSKLKWYIESGMKKRNADLTAHLRDNFADAVRRSARSSKPEASTSGLAYMAWKNTLDKVK
ncbi:related to ITC1-subunit of Isw2 chromatin remodelling complex [Sporisorium reilianum SRZ2]|uniref:Related to ITC1-subunit of Isw2 chromatin remodelling complex n=1 Tax=Sporisorium reilianum (strain SRZ2) TaxID=999809 RepID=E6ZRB9_SPORE|nr:related to ITC1-subunit of Isw2 chromatin remodelling complex [Sporisorium reilianum SRZ2]